MPGSGAHGPDADAGDFSVRVYTDLGGTVAYQSLSTESARPQADQCYRRADCWWKSGIVCDPTADRCQDGWYPAVCRRIDENSLGVCGVYRVCWVWRRTRPDSFTIGHSCHATGCTDG